MTRVFIVAIAAAFISTGASAQTIGGPAAGSGDAAKASSSLREENASYNRVIGSMGEARKRGRAVAAAPSDIVAGSELRDVNGVPVGVVESVEGDSAVVSTALGRVKIPLIGFGKDKIGLMLSMSATELEAAVRAATGG